MNYLGISDSSVNGGASLLQDGKVTCSINEERLNRKKMSTGFPELSIDYVLKCGRTKVSEIETVYVADQHNYFKPVSSAWEGWLKDVPSLSKKIMYTLSSQLSKVVGNSPFAQNCYHSLKRFLTKGRQEAIEGMLREKFGITAPVEFIDHHKAHAFSAYCTAGFKDATVITLDGGGDGLCSRVFNVSSGEFHQMNTLNSYHSIGNFYSYVTKISGFTAHKHEGKITGLAAYGKPVYKDLLKNMIRYQDGQIKNVGNAYFWAAVRKIEKGLAHDYKKEDLSASIQVLLEEEVCKYIEHWMEKGDSKNIVLAGGIFANVKLNQRIHELKCVEQIFVHPGMGDDGLCFGAACAGMFLEKERGTDVSYKEPVNDVYLGPEYNDEEVTESLNAFNLSYTRFSSVEEKIATLLSKDFVIARFNGRMEYGPRALGNRSILYQPNDETINDWLNKRLNRTEFMPFAPAIMKDMKEKCFFNTAGAERAAEFMTVTFDCTEEMKNKCPGVVHIDGTARPQFVTEQSNLSFYKIIKEFHALTGVPALINTSFNMHEEPIVCTPKDAIRGFLDGNLDYLAIGNFIVRNPNLKTNQFGKPLLEL